MPPKRQAKKCAADGSVKTSTTLSPSKARLEDVPSVDPALEEAEEALSQRESAVQPQTAEELEKLLAEIDEPVALGAAELQEIAEYEEQIRKWRTERTAKNKKKSTSHGGTGRSGVSGGGATLAERRESQTGNEGRDYQESYAYTADRQAEFTFGTLVKNVLPPEMAHQDSEMVAEALLEVASARLENLNMTSTEHLVCLTNITHLYLQHNRISSLDGLEFMLNLQVLVLRGNQITSLEPLTLLPIKVLDVAYNKLAGNLAEVAQFLPFETLEALCMHSNPCTPSEKDAMDPQAASMTSTVRSYRDIVELAAPLLTYLDGVEVTPEEVERNGMAPREETGNDVAISSADGTVPGTKNLAKPTGPESGNVRSGSEVTAEEGDDEDFEIAELRRRLDAAALMETNVSDADFGLGDDPVSSGGIDGRGRSPSKGQTAYTRPSDLVTSPSKSSSRSQPVPLNLADGVVSKTRQLAEELMKRYEKQLDDKERLSRLAVSYIEQSKPSSRAGGRKADAPGPSPRGANPPPAATAETQPTSNDSSDDQEAQFDEEKLSEVCHEQKQLRDELRQLGSHRGKVANAHIVDMWREADEALERMSEKTAERRRQLSATQDAPSSGYQRALEKLKAMSGGQDLDKYRRPVSADKVQLLPTEPGQPKAPTRFLGTKKFPG